MLCRVKKTNKKELNSRRSFDKVFFLRKKAVSMKKLEQNNRQQGEFYHIMASNFGFFSAAEVEVTLKLLKILGKKVLVWKRCEAYLCQTEKPGEVRMGKGRGTKVRQYTCPVFPGKVLFTVIGVRQVSMAFVFNQIASKVSISLKLLEGNKYNK
jgi:ribosomal protein L16/L10AE